MLRRGFILTGMVMLAVAPAVAQERPVARAAPPQQLFPQFSLVPAGDGTVWRIDHFSDAVSVCQMAARGEASEPLCQNARFGVPAQASVRRIPSSEQPQAQQSQVPQEGAAR